MAYISDLSKYKIYDSTETIPEPDLTNAIQQGNVLDMRTPTTLTQEQKNAGYRIERNSDSTGSTYSAPTIEQVYDFQSPFQDSEYDSALAQAVKYYGGVASTPVDERAIRRQTLQQFQAQIDATNKIYGEMLGQARLEGTGRLGSSRAIQARSGTLGSDFGAAQTDKVQTYNRGIENSIQAEQAAKIAEILNLGNKQASEEIAAKRKAQQEGLDSYLNFLGAKTERQTARFGELIQAFIDQEIDPGTLKPEEIKALAKQYGVSESAITAQYKSKKKEYDAAQAEASAKQAKDLSFNLSEGQDRYGYNPDTGEYELIASKAKTYAPGSTGPGSKNSIFTSEDARTLYGQGFSEEYINHLSEGIRQYGAQEVLDNEDLSKEQRAALEAVLNKEQKKITTAQLNDEAIRVSQANIENALRGKYTIEELKAKADEYGYSGFWTGKATDVQKFLESPEARQLYAEFLREQYQNSGYTIAE